MSERLAYLWPEIVLFAFTCVVMVIGLSPKYLVRKLSAWVAGLGLVLAGIAAALLTPKGSMFLDSLAAGTIHGQSILPDMVGYIKVLTCGIGLMLLLVLTGTVDRLEERRIAAGLGSGSGGGAGGGFDALRSNRAEFYSFFLFSLTGLMLVAGADDLIWLFLALELTSLPTYIMVTISSGRHRAQEAGVKYFFLGALGAAVFLYGFALLYGATGSTNLNVISSVLGSQLASGSLSPIAMAGILISVLGLCFKIAAVPMHFYAADVYQGASAGVAAFLAFVPKTAGFVAILLLCGAVGWNVGDGNLPEPLRVMLWVIAALTMTIGNVLALLQSSLKRMLAYSSIAHSGYMLVGVVAGPGAGSFWTNGLSAVLFYLLSYGVMNVGAFAVLACVEKPGKSEETDDDNGPREIETFEDLRGLCSTRPMLGWTMVISVLSLLGMPPLLGFFAKLPLFAAAINAGELPLVIVLGLNSAIAAFYYLRVVATVYLDAPDTSVPTRETEFFGRHLAGVLSAGGVLLLSVIGGLLMPQAVNAGNYRLQYRGEKTPSDNPEPGTTSLQDAWQSLPGRGGARLPDTTPASSQ